MRKKLVYITAAILAISLGLFFNVKFQNSQPPFLETVELQTLDQKPYPLSQHQNQTIILNFWASWCPPCVEEMPELNTLYMNTLQKENIELIGIAIDKPDNIKNFLNKTPVQYPIVLGGFNATAFAKQLGNENGALPFTVIISAEGEVILKKSGKIHPEEILQALVKH